MRRFNAVMVLTSLALVAFTTIACSSKTFEPENSVTPDSSSVLTPFPEINCGNPDASLNALADWQETNLSALKRLKDPEQVENKVRLTSAGLLSNELPFVTMDRDCWAEFFTAFSNSLDKTRAPSKEAAKLKLDETRSSADAWLACIEARHPGLLDEAKKIRACFP